MTTTVYNLENDTEAVYSLPPEEAVIAAFAQFERLDFDFLGYSQRYGNRVRRGEVSVLCGDWCAVL